MKQVDKIPVWIVVFSSMAIRALEWVATSMAEAFMEVDYMEE